MSKPPSLSLQVSKPPSLLWCVSFSLSALTCFASVAAASELLLREQAKQRGPLLCCRLALGLLRTAGIADRSGAAGRSCGRGCGRGSTPGHCLRLRSMHLIGVIPNTNK